MTQLNASPLPFIDRWRFPRLAALLLASLALYGSWAWLPVTRAWWDAVDRQAFFALNGILSGNSFWPWLFGIANHRAFDVVALAAMLSVAGTYVLRGGRAERTERLAVCLFIILYTIVVTQIWRQFYDIRRMSPSLVLEPVIRLSELVPQLGTKDHSYNSFPGDHAAVLFMVWTLLYLAAIRRHAVLVALIAFSFSLPRLVAGAHWLTDILVGAGVIALTSLTLALCTPIAARATRACARLLQFPLAQRLIMKW